MKKPSFLAAFVAFLTVTLAFTNCLHIVEEVSVKDNGTGHYTMTLDMSEMKSMLDMFKNMNTEGEDAATEGDETVDGEPSNGENEEPDAPPALPEDEEVAEEEGGEDADPSKIGQEFANVAEVLKKVKGLNNVIAINDTANFKFGYAFDFADIASLNKGLELVNSEKFDAKAKDVFGFSKKKFIRSGAANFGEEIKRTLSEDDGEDGEGNMAMMKMMFGEMTYKQIYHFDRKIKSASNKNAQISNDGKSVTLTLKPFADDNGNSSVANEIKLK